MQLMQNALGLDAPALRAFNADGTGHGASATQFADQLVSLYTFGGLFLEWSNRPRTATPIADDRQLASPYARRLAASFEER